MALFLSSFGSNPFNRAQLGETPTPLVAAIIIKKIEVVAVIG